MGGRLSSISPVTERVSSHQGATPDPTAPLPPPHLLLRWAGRKRGYVLSLSQCLVSPGGAYITVRVWKLSSGCGVLGNGPGATFLVLFISPYAIIPPKCTSHRLTPLCSGANMPLGNKVQSHRGRILVVESVCLFVCFHDSDFCWSEVTFPITVYPIDSFNKHLWKIYHVPGTLPNTGLQF